ncbi:MAG: hypothetical protein ACK43N_14465, partial [Pirellulaceae bacterium]
MEIQLLLHRQIDRRLDGDEPPLWFRMARGSEGCNSPGGSFEGQEERWHQGFRGGANLMRSTSRTT